MFETLTDVVENAKEHGGGTFESVPGGWERIDYDDGYMVSGFGGWERLEEESLAAEAWFFNLENLGALATGPARFGMWRDEDGKWSLDLSYHFNYLELAELAAEISSQRAIWDCKNQVAINI